MNFTFSKEEEAFRLEVRDWIAHEVPPKWHEIDAWLWEETDESWDISREFQRKLANKGWLAPAYPTEYGGANMGHIKRLILAEELAYYFAPVGVETEMAVNWVGMALLHFGNEKQKKDYVPKIARGEIVFCIGYSEPNSGSDLASLQASAVEKGDEYIINGQKIWCSFAHLADYCWLAARTDTQAPKHQGISIFVVDMKTPGITVRPLINILDRHSFNEVFFDDVHIPKDNLVGVKNQGWYQVAMALDFERSNIQTAAGNRKLLDILIDFVKTTKRDGKWLSEDPIIRNELAAMATEIEVSRMMCYRIAWMYSAGMHSNYESSMGMLFASESFRRIADLGARILGYYGLLDQDSKWAVARGRIMRTCLAALSIGVGGGTNEIQRNIIAMRGLGLPRK